MSPQPTFNVAWIIFFIVSVAVISGVLLTARSIPNRVVARLANVAGQKEPWWKSGERILLTLTALVLMFWLLVTYGY